MKITWAAESYNARMPDSAQSINDSSKVEKNVELQHSTLIGTSNRNKTPLS